MAMERHVDAGRDTVCQHCDTHDQHERSTHASSRKNSLQGNEVGQRKGPAGVLRRTPNVRPVVTPMHCLGQWKLADNFVHAVARVCASWTVGAPWRIIGTWHTLYDVVFAYDVVNHVLEETPIEIKSDLSDSPWFCSPSWNIKKALAYFSPPGGKEAAGRSSGSS